MESGMRCGSSSERCRYQQNWCILAAFCTLVGFSYSSALPSLHQFVTSSTTPDDPDLQPGLGLSETWYSWIVSIISVGELAGAVATSVLMRKVFIKFLMLANLSLCAFGGLLYGVGKYGWMLLIGRFFIGYYIGAVTVVLRTYVGETCSTVIAAMPPEKREKSNLKNTAFFATFIVCTMSSLSGPSLDAIVAQIPSIDQFRWLGYFTIIYSFLLGVVTMVLFKEKRGDVQKKGGPVLLKTLPIPLYVSLLIA
jgi:MFS family permease